MSLKSKPIVPSRAEPTAYELAKLAVAVLQANRDRHGYSEPDALKDALAFWLNARELLEKWRTTPASVFPEPPPAPAVPALPEPKRYPVSIDEFLRLMLPSLSGRTGDKYGLFREYLAFRLQNPSRPDSIWADPVPGWNIPADRIPFDCCNPRIVPGTEKPYSVHDIKPAKPPAPTKDDVDRYFALWRANPIPNQHSFLYHARGFRDWYQTMHAAEVSIAHRAAGAKGLASKKRKSKKSKAPVSKA